MQLTDNIYDGFQKQLLTVSVQIDFEAAFDRIPHTRFLTAVFEIDQYRKQLNILKTVAMCQYDTNNVILKTFTFPI